MQPYKAVHDCIVTEITLNMKFSSSCACTYMWAGSNMIGCFACSSVRSLLAYWNLTESQGTHACTSVSGIQLKSVGVLRRGTSTSIM